MRRKVNSPPLSLFSFQDMITGLSGIMIFLVLIMVLDLVTAKPVPPPEKTVVEHDDIDKLRAEVVKLKKQYDENARMLNLVIVSSTTNDLDVMTTMTQDASQMQNEIVARQSQISKLKDQLETLKLEKAASERKRLEKESVRKALEEAIAKIPENVVTIIFERGQSKVPIYVDCSLEQVKVHFPIQKKDTLLYGVNEAANKLRLLAQDMDKTTSYFVFLIRPSSVNYAFELEEAIKNMGFNTGRDPLPEDKILKFST